METIRQCLETPIYDETPLNIVSMTENNDGILTIVLNGRANVIAGDKVHFSRSVANEEYDRNVIVADHVATVERVDRDSGTTKIKMVAPKRNVGYIDRIELLDENGLGVNISENGHKPVKWKKVVFTDDVKLFAQDVVSNGIALVPIVNGVENKHIDSYTLAERLSITHDTDKGVEAKDFLMRKGFIQDVLCGDEAYISGVTQEYYYEPERLVKNAIFLPDGYDESVLMNGMVHIEFSQNEFYHRDSDGNCVFWDDYNSKLFKNAEYNQSEYADVENDRNIVNASLITSYWRVNVGFSPDTDSAHLYQEAMVNDMFVKKVKDSLVPPMINMEKIKFVPAILSGGKFVEASAVTYNMHFRTRDKFTWDYVDGGDAWNGIRSYGDITTENKKVQKSDLVGFLGFTDGDIRYQKMKVSKSFIRMSYYDTNDFIDGALLGYSTIFMDSGSLFGKYIKVRSHMMKNGYAVDDPDEPYAVTVFSGATDRVDSEFTVRNEFYYDKSSEGFNIYYFATDAPRENETKTIYMRVEFNHAGFGKTIPMIKWPVPNRLTLDSYKSGLYIPIKLMHINGKYYYYVDSETNNPCIINDAENATIKFNLFEPKL